MFFCIKHEDKHIANFCTFVSHFGLFRSENDGAYTKMVWKLALRTK